MSMKVTYIRHSGFAVEMEDKVLIFDYYRGELPAFGRDRDVYVFVSHKHYDHYQRSIFTWTEKFPRITYILSSDVEEAVPSSAPKDNMYFMEPGETLQIKAGESELLIETLRSTDEGVAFVVKTAGHTIYHAGDLNWWHWEEETDTYNRFMKEAYQKEIGMLEGMHIDAAFVPLDPRLDREYYWGLDWFMRHTDTDVVFPMHMQDQYVLYDRLMEEESALDYKTRVAHITREGQSFELD